MEGLNTLDHSLVLSHYWLTWEFLAAWLPLWPDSSLINQPDLQGLLLGGHVDVSLSADTNSAWIQCNQNSPPHIGPSSSFLDSRITGACQAPSHYLDVVNLKLKKKIDITAPLYTLNLCMNKYIPLLDLTKTKLLKDKAVVGNKLSVPAYAVHILKLERYRED